MAKEVIGVDPENGKLLWQFAHENQWKQNICMPVLVDNMLFISSPETGARGLKLAKNGDGYDVEEVWSTKKIQFYHVSTVNQGDYVYGSTATMGPALFAAVNVKDGEIAWRKRGFAKANCLLADQRLIILDEEGKLGLVSFGPKDFTIDSEFKLFDDRSWTVPTVVGKTLYARNQKEIVALDLG